MSDIVERLDRCWNSIDPKAREAALESAIAIRTLRSDLFVAHEQCRTLRAALAEVEARLADALKWRNAINDYLTQEWCNPLKDDESPYAALRRILKCELMEMALNPIRIKAIQAEIAQAKRDALGEAARLARHYATIVPMHGSLKCDIYEAAGQAAAEIAASIDALAEKELLSEDIIRADRDAWPDHQANDPVRPLAKGERE